MLSWPLAALVLSGCATELTFRHREALDSLVGQNRAELVSRLGPPTRTSDQGGSELLSYDDTEMKWMPGEPGTRNGDNIAIGPWVDKAQCTTTFRVDGGRVDAWSLSGNECRNPTFPALGGADEHALARAAEAGVNQTANFAHNNFTGRSVVNDGEFQSQ